MTARRKMLARMRANPRDWRIEDLETLARQYGFAARKPGGSHVIFCHAALAEMLSVPARRPIKAVYVRRFVALIEQVDADENEE